MAPPDFNPFAALGLQPNTALTAAAITTARRRCLLHRCQQSLTRFPATATAFPSLVELNVARDYLREAFNGYGGDTAVASWHHRHRDVFFPDFPLGDPRVFPGATASGGASAPASASASASGPASASASASASRAATAGSAGRPVVIESDDDEPDTPTPATRHRRPASAAHRAPRHSRSSSPPATASGSYASYRRRDPFASASDDDDSDDAANATALATPGGMVNSSASAIPAPYRPRSSGNRSAGRSRRATAIPNPVTNERIVVGTALDGNGNPRANAVGAGFDAGGRMFYRITHQDMNGNAVAAPTGTAISFQNIRLRPAYAGMDAATLRATVDRHLRLPFHQRP